MSRASTKRRAPRSTRSRARPEHGHEYHRESGHEPGDALLRATPAPPEAAASPRGGRIRAAELARAVLRAGRPHADRHPDLDRARTDGADLCFHDDERADPVGRAEVVYRDRAVRDHGGRVLRPRRELPDPWRRRATDDRFRDVD